MTDTDKSQALRVFLGKLPGPVALRLAKAVEIDRLGGGKGLPHALVLEGLRPVLRGTSASGNAQIRELLLADLERHAVAIRAVHQPAFDAKGVVDQVAGFAALSGAVAREALIEGDSDLDRRVKQLRAGVAEVMASAMTQAPAEILGALPILEIGSYAGGPRMPDLSQNFDGTKADHARRYAEFVSGCKPFAAAAAFGTVLTQVSEEIAVALLSYCDGLVRERRAAGGERREVAEQYFGLATALAAYFLDARESETLVRRGTAATSPQAA